VTTALFIDSDVFLDTVLQRQPHSVASEQVLGMCETAEARGYTSSLILSNLYFILRRISTHTKAIEAVQKIRSYIDVLPVTDKEIGESIEAGFRDFEDGIQYFVCVNHKIDCFITRNVKDFKKASITVLTPKEWLETLRKE
jgi:predicted nucleic acid-binding protein